jgi:Glycosyl hydrolase family 12
MSEPNETEERCRPGDTLARGELTLENNCWGAEGVAHFKQCVSASSDRLGWTWDYPAEEPDRVKAYPEVIFGKKPFTPGPSTTVRLPRPLLPVPSFTVEFTSRTHATGRYNAAFEIWLTDSPLATPASITHEVMFWVGHGGNPSPAGAFDRTVTPADGRTCDLWIGPMQSWNYLAFVFRQPVPSGTIDFGLYMSELLRQGNIPRTAFIADLEFGNEVWYGAGETVLDAYRVTGLT